MSRVDFDELSEFDYFEKKLVGKVYISKAFAEKESGRLARFASKVFDGEEIHKFFKKFGEIVLHVSPGERFEIKALFYEDSREIKFVTLQRFSVADGNPHKHTFTFSGTEIESLAAFITSIPDIDIPDAQGLRIDDSVLQDVLISKEQALNLVNANRSVFEEILKVDISLSEITALAYKKDQVIYFDRLINEKDFFNLEKTRLGFKRNEQVWQQFFESNTWILGYGLDYIFNTPLQDRRLEQVIKGYDAFGSGKRVDALMKTRGIINSLGFCELKTHLTPLIKNVKNPYRPESWSISDELAGGVAQIQKTVQKSIENIRTSTQMKDEQGNRLDEELFLYQPKSFLLIGSLGEFNGDSGINEDKFSSFELFRRHIVRPEIITFDELLERAKFLVELKTV